MAELKECPFCGKKVACITTAKELEECKLFESEECPCFDPYEEGCNWFTIVCDYSKGGCGATGSYFSDVDKAILRWNTRGESWR